MKDLTGKTFGSLTAVFVDHADAHRERHWKCVCACGKEIVVRQSNLTSGKTKSCGCVHRNKYDFAGHCFGKLTAISFLPGSAQSKAKWLCLCECGEHVLVETHDLISCRVTDCGCTPKRSVRYNEMKHQNERLYTIWRGMKNRCYYSKHKNFACYGGRGIRVCDEWLHSFDTFATWALANEYRSDLTIDRIDVDGNYAPGNCRWITMQAQQRNKRKRPLPKNQQEAGMPSDGNDTGTGTN
jgi:hypothetical protein